MKIAIVGAGVAGLVAARELHPRHEITLFEAESHIGGHVHTHALAPDLAVDSGFIVYNERTYPAFTRLLAELDIPTRPTTMSFAVTDEQSGLEYNGADLSTLFAQRRNLLRPSFLAMIRDILRFNRAAPGLLDDPRSFGAVLADGGYGKAFVERYIVPMGAAIWSADPADILAFPAAFFIRFFHNHGLLSVNDRPQWRTIVGGSARYVEALVAPFRERIRRGTRIERVERTARGVALSPGGEFDAVVLACHADQALALLADATEAEREVLGALGYRENDVVLHSDVRILPANRRARAAWNCRLGAALSVTYDMNVLQGLESREPLLVTLNPPATLDGAKVIKRLRYRHPRFTPAAIAAQRRHAAINGRSRVYFCGAYWRHGFHEDGVQSALAAVSPL